MNESVDLNLRDALVVVQYVDGCGIIGPIVHHDEFPVFICLVNYRLNAICEEEASVIAAYDDRDKRVLQALCLIRLLRLSL